MDKINCNRVILGGLLAGVVINIGEHILNGVILMDQWVAAMQALGKSGETTTGQMVVYILWGFLVGIFAIWLYAAIRPRYGAGPKTALRAGIAVWILGYFTGWIMMVTMDLFPVGLSTLGTIVGLVEVLIGTELGAWLYKEKAAAGAAAQ